MSRSLREEWKVKKKRERKVSKTYRQSTAVESRSSSVSRWCPLFADGPAAFAVAAEPAWLRQVPLAPNGGTEPRTAVETRRPACSRNSATTSRHTHLRRTADVPDTHC